MYVRTDLDEADGPLLEDNVVFLYRVTWKDYLRLLEIRGESSAPRLTYLEGVLEIMSPSGPHEKTKSFVGRLVEAYCLDKGIPFTPFGSWTIKSSKSKSGAEPDECYVFGARKAKRPDLAIEVVQTSGRLDKLEVYRRLGVREVWYWRNGRLQPYVLRRGKYEPVDRSRCLPGLDIDLLTRFLDRPTAYHAIKAFRAALKARGAN